MQLIFALIKKEWLMDWRSKTAIFSIILYAFLIVFFVFFSFRNVDPLTWQTLLWIILLFACINAIAKSFLQEAKSLWLYFYTLHSPTSLFIAKSIYNFLILVFLSVSAIFIYSLLLGFPVQDITLFVIGLLLSLICFSTLFSLMTAIAAKAGKNASMVTILSLPVIIPLISVISNFSKKTLTQQSFSLYTTDIFLLVAINIIIMSLAVILFKFVWIE